MCDSATLPSPPGQHFLGGGGESPIFSQYDVSVVYEHCDVTVTMTEVLRM